jgi:glycosyltransferase involved in cell wall biosynthesis
MNTSESSSEVLVPARPLVSIALSMHNSAATIDAALRSLVAQSYRHWELFLHDDGSTDASVECVRRWRDERIHLIVDSERRGLTTRLNQIIDAARGKYYARMDADDIAYPDRVAKQVAFLEAHPAVDVLAAQMMVFAADGRPVGVHVVGAAHEEICARPYSGFYFPHPTWMGRLDWFRRWRYDERFLKAQDQELLRRAYRTSRFAGLLEPLVGYRQDRVSIGKSWRGRATMMRSIAALAVSERAPMRGAVAVSMQFAKGLVDTVAVASMRDRIVLRHRARPFQPVDGLRWAQVWAACSREAG